MRCELCDVQYEVCSVHCAVCIVQCSVFSVQCALFSVQYAVCSVQKQCRPFVEGGGRGGGKQTDKNIGMSQFVTAQEFTRVEVGHLSSQYQTYLSSQIIE